MVTYTVIGFKELRTCLTLFVIMILDNKCTLHCLIICLFVC